MQALERVLVWALQGWEQAVHSDHGHQPPGTWQGMSVQLSFPSMQVQWLQPSGFISRVPGWWRCPVSRSRQLQ